MEIGKSSKKIPGFIAQLRSSAEFTKNMIKYSVFIFQMMVSSPGDITFGGYDLDKLEKWTKIDMA